MAIPMRRPEEEIREVIVENVREVRVEISVEGGTISVDSGKDPFWVSKEKNEEVRWILKGEGDFLVDFKDDSPFYESQFSKVSPVSGLVRRDVLPNDKRVYKYTVWIKDLKELDPGGGVRP